jgi:hypothetical protein
MFQFNYKLKVSERVKAKCDRHPRYNPEREGRGGIKGGCSTCFSLFDLHQARLSLDAAHREFLRRATPWSYISGTREQGDHQPGIRAGTVSKRRSTRKTSAGLAVKRYEVRNHRCGG